MTDAIRSLLAQVPWLKAFIAWAIAALALLLILAVPAYFILLPLAQRLRAQLSRHLNLVRERHSQKRIQRKSEERELVERFA